MIIEALLGVTFLAALIVFVAPDAYAGKLAAALSALPILGSLWMWAAYDATGNALLGGDIAFETDFVWLTVGGLDLHWFVGVDGISLPLVVLTAVLTTLAIVSAWTPISERQSQFYGLVLLMEANLLGVFTALDFFAWFVFWEAVLVPMYFLIGVWGGPNRRYAAIKFFVYTNIASLVMFIGFIALVFGLGDSVSSLRLPEIAQALRAGELAGFAGLDAADVRSDLPDRAGDVQPGDERQVVVGHARCIAVEDPEVVAVDRAGVDVDDRLARARFGCLPLDDAHALRSDQLGECCGAHGPPSTPSVKTVREAVSTARPVRRRSGCARGPGTRRSRRPRRRSRVRFPSPRARRRRPRRRVATPPRARRRR